MASVQNIVILGSGNVASHLAPALNKAGYNIVQVYSRTPDHALEISKKVNAAAVSEIEKITNEADLYVMCVSDTAILPILKQRNWEGKFLAHTAGSISLEICKPYTSRYGVIYPFQTFTKGKEINISEVPFFVEASGDRELNELKQVAEKISKHVIQINSNQREKLHLAGVFANNFVNYMFTIATEILEKENLPQHLLKPLLEETFKKALEIGPAKSQTGPAIRNNQEVMQKHVQLLQQNSDWQKIYTFVSESIQKYYSSND